jgi:hypothetical protein
MKHKTEILNDLWNAMSSLYDARYRACGPQGPEGGRPYPEMDVETFSEIASLQTNLQTLISRLDKKET